MGYVGEFQLSEDDTPTKNPAALAGATGRKGQIGDQNQSPVTKQNRAGNAMRFYWCKATNSVERFRGGVLA
ncbi:hypothetical protein A8B74_07410 [Sulfitobacter geojensis]|nr:hypothetical protein A8B74_07410 [Sulfitobacter geojensis]